MNPYTFFFLSFLPASGTATDAVLICVSFLQAEMPVYQNNVFTLLTNISVPSQGSDITNFLVKQEGESRIATPVFY